MNIKLLLFFCVTCSLLPLWGFNVVTDSRPAATVYVSSNALPAEMTAAQELISYVKQMTGATLPLTHQLPVTGNRILLGADDAIRKLLPNIPFQALKMDEIILDTPDARTLILSGDRPRGTLYATYTLLEDWGVRFWAPYYESVPKVKNLNMTDRHVRYASPFDFRQPFSQTTVAHPGWNAKMKVNGHIWMRPLTESLGGGRQMDMRHSMTRDFVKPKEFFARHPEWYAWNKKENKRLPTQLCLTNREVLQQLTREVRKELQADPKREFISISINDNNQCCQCPACSALVKREGANSALSIHAANFVARAIARDFPKVKVVTLAYWPTERPPKSIQMEPNCGVIFAMLDRNHGVPVSKIGRHNPFLKKWQKLSHGTVYIWDYWADFRNFLLPMPTMFTQGANMRTYREHQVRGVFSQLPFGTLAEFVDLRAWMFARLCWNPDLDDRALIKEYLDGMYAQGAPFIMQYIDLLENAKNRRPNTFIGVYSESTNRWLKPVDILAGRKLFLQALEATKGTVHHDHIERIFASNLMVTAQRYAEVESEAKKLNQTLPAYQTLVDQLEHLGKRYKCDTFKEWQAYSALIARFRKGVPTIPNR